MGCSPLQESKEHCLSQGAAAARVATNSSRAPFYPGARRFFSTLLLWSNSRRTLPSLRDTTSADKSAAGPSSAHSRSSSLPGLSPGSASGFVRRPYWEIVRPPHAGLTLLRGKVSRGIRANLAYESVTSRLCRPVCSSDGCCPRNPDVLG